MGWVVVVVVGEGEGGGEEEEGLDSYLHCQIPLGKFRTLISCILCLNQSFKFLYL